MQAAGRAISLASWQTNGVLRRSDRSKITLQVERRAYKLLAGSRLHAARCWLVRALWVGRFRADVPKVAVRELCQQIVFKRRVLLDGESEFDEHFARQGP